MLDAVHLGGGKREIQGQLTRIEISGNINEVSEPVEGDEHS